MSPAASTSLVRVEGRSRQERRTAMLQQNTELQAQTTRTRRLLACGIIAGPVFLTVTMVQAITRRGFDLSRHPVSLLSLGDFGWLQIANFVVTGALCVA